LHESSADIGGDANLELVDKFGFLGDKLSVDGDADAAVENRIRYVDTSSAQGDIPGTLTIKENTTVNT